MLVEDVSYPLFQCPGSLLISGPSHSGKTVCISQILLDKEKLFSQQPKHIIYCHSEEPDNFLNQIPDLIFHQGAPTEEDVGNWIRDFRDDIWVLVLDDLHSEFFNSDISVKLLSKFVHHHNCFIVVVSHALFGHGKHARFSSLNFHYFMLTRTCRDLGVISRFGVQLFGKGHSSQFLQVYLDATDLKPNGRVGYLLINCHPICGHRNRMLYTNIFSDEEPLVLYRF